LSYRHNILSSTTSFLHIHGIRHIPIAFPIPIIIDKAAIFIFSQYNFIINVHFQHTNYFIILRSMISW